MPDSTSLPWLVVYTKPRQEKKLAQRLTQLGFEVYCPTQRIKKRWSDRWKWIEQPLFTSHLFIQIDPERCDAIYFVPGFVRFLFWLKRPALVRPQEIDTLKRLLNDFTPEAIQVESLLPGQHLKIQSGPLQGQEAQLLEHRRDSMLLYLPSIQLQVRVDLSHTEIQAV
jgi:transcriptional antiterminator RfaH